MWISMMVCHLDLQIIGKHFDEATIYRVAHAFEQATDFHKQKPEL